MPPWIEGPIFAVVLFFTLFFIGIVFAILRPVAAFILWTIIEIIRFLFYPALIFGSIGLVVYYCF